jgi:hypothetical protein
MRRRRRAYLDHFQKSASGEYVYSGDHYAYQDRGTPRRKALGVLWLGLGAAAALILAGGCIPAPGVGGCAYVLIPYVAAVICVFMGLWAMSQLALGGEPLREYVYQDTVEKLPTRLLLTAIFAALAAVGEGVYLLRNGGSLLYGLLFLGMQLLAAGAAFFARRYLCGLEWAKTPQKWGDLDT